jgi:ATP-dependent DNA helicase RecG
MLGENCTGKLIGLKKLLSAEDLADCPITQLKRVGPKVAERLARLGIRSLQDLLFHLPLRYQDRTRIRPIASLRLGDQAVIEGVVELAEVKFGRRRALLVELVDGSGQIILRFFHFSSAQQKALRRGSRLRCFGEVRNGPNRLEMIHPEYQQVNGEDACEVEGHLTPIYPTTEGVHQLTLRGLTDQALAWLAREPDALREWLPQAILARFQFVELRASVSYLHRPPPDAPQDQLLSGTHPAQQRLTFEELLAHQISLRLMRAKLRRAHAPKLASSGHLRMRLLESLPFRLTAAQQRVGQEIEQDLAQAVPMQRLVQGDVGSGKTIVAALAALQAIEAGLQVAMMAPTELLAEQHLRNLAVWLQPLQVEMAWLTGRLKGKPREQVLHKVAEAEAQLVVGTHALFQQDVRFAALGLVIIDEQHRFGVHQRLALREKGRTDGHTPHQLIMTATPIPRTLAMTAYADLDLSVIDELPPGRKPVTTVAIPDTRRAQVVARVQAACAQGRQAYWVCTLIEESETLQCQAAEDTAQLLAEALPMLRIGLLHGRVKQEDKDHIMASFKRGGLDLLVATTVIEVGVDVPNASLMIIENPERLGLAQLHQLRGRVGRGNAESHCVLMYHAPLSQNARQRLAILRETNDGFLIAKEDLEMRGPGEVLGTRQTGEMQLRIADLARDQAMLDDVREVADLMLRRYPENAQALIRRWIGRRADYARV